MVFESVLKLWWLSCETNITYVHHSIPFTHADFKHLSEEARSSLEELQICFTPIHIKVLKGTRCGGQHQLFCHIWTGFNWKMVVWFLHIGKTEDSGSEAPSVLDQL